MNIITSSSNQTRTQNEVHESTKKHFPSKIVKCALFGIAIFSIAMVTGTHESLKNFDFTPPDPVEPDFTPSHPAAPDFTPSHLVEPDFVPLYLAAPACPLAKLDSLLLRKNNELAATLFQSLKTTQGISCENYVEHHSSHSYLNVPHENLKHPVMWGIDDIERPFIAVKYKAASPENLKDFLYCKDISVEHCQEKSNHYNCNDELAAFTIHPRGENSEKLAMLGSDQKCGITTAVHGEEIINNVSALFAGNAMHITPDVGPQIYTGHPAILTLAESTVVMSN